MRKKKYEVLGEPICVSTDGLVERARCYPVEVVEIGVAHDLLAPDDMDQALDRASIRDGFT